ncbi:30S ribosomal protein S6 [Sulfidibacter corallicola]|uniref:Small ribosomal subunit protein bS6 n=1 Tax=Sulfidibacter corallicola TaxID=2818388 RepID=A0A8A4TUC0_SULCO|nr:30S ribosomal protein S6 [Sulfidibacter corallicola]QTD52957.1 30S ribosomal protein S6 [Sulfidibacter corallicola]
MNTYESVFISAPTVAPEAYEQLVGHFEEVITKNGGTVHNTIRWGRRQLAYEIKKFRDGIYTIFEMEAPGDIIKELERQYRLNESIIKFLTVKTERKKKLIQKGTAKRQAKQEARQKRKARKASSDN